MSTVSPEIVNLEPPKRTFKQLCISIFSRAPLLVWMGLALFLIAGLTACIVVANKNQHKSGSATQANSHPQSLAPTTPKPKAKSNSTSKTKATSSKASNSTAGSSSPSGKSSSSQTSTYTIPSNAIIVNTSAAFQSALNSASSGATIALRSGVYTSISFTLSKRLTIEAYPGETVWLDGQNSLQYAIFMVTNASGSMLRGIGFRNYASTKNFSQKPAIVIVTGSVTSGITIDHCTFQDSAAVGASVSAKSSVITNNVFKDNNWLGLLVNRADGTVVKNNIMSNNNTGNNPTSGSTAAAAGAKFTYTRGATIKNNQFINNKANGLWIDLQSSDMVITGNKVTGNTRNGIYYEVSTTGTITGNTVTGNTVYGVELSGSNHTTVTGNSLSSNSGGNTFVQEDPRTAANNTDCATGASYGADCDSYGNNVQ